MKVADVAAGVRKAVGHELKHKPATSIWLDET